MMFEIKSKTVGQWQENAYCLLIDHQSVLIDPGDEYDVLRNEFEVPNFIFHSILLTHGHFDHIGAVHNFQTEFNIPTYLHSKDKRIANQANLFRKFAGDNTIVKSPIIDFFLDEVSEFKLGNFTFEFHHTPGHSLGSVCVAVHNNLFCGDVILQNGIGRTDLPGGNYNTIVQSVNYIIDRFENFDIYPGHGNPFVLNHSVIDKLKKQIK
jgi:hydroxyacylglutathione hydrolase